MLYEVITVPGGEHAPFLDWLPKAASDWIRRVASEERGRRRVREVPCVGGQVRAA